MEGYLSGGVNYDACNMMYVIFCGKWFLLPVVRWSPDQKDSFMVGVEMTRILLLL
jgi:hypothetical protein